MERRSFAKGLTALPLILGGAAGRSVQAQARRVPDKPLHIVVPFAAGGSTDDRREAVSPARRPAHFLRLTAASRMGL